MVQSTGIPVQVSSSRIKSIRYPHKYDTEAQFRDHYVKREAPAKSSPNKKSEKLFVTNMHLQNRLILSPSFQKPIQISQSQPPSYKVVQLQEINNWPGDRGGEDNICQREGAQDRGGSACQFRQRFNKNFFNRSIGIFVARNIKQNTSTVLEKEHYRSRIN